MIWTILLTILAALGLILQFRHDELKKSSRKKILSWSIIILSIVLLVGNNIRQSIDSTSLENKIAKLDSTLVKVDNKQDSLRRNYDTLLHSYIFSQTMLNDANIRIESLLKTTERGFKENKDAINDIEKIKIKDARIISTHDEERLIQILSQGKGSKVEFGTINTSDEAIMLSGQLQSIFKKAGWDVSDERWLAPDSKYVGIFMFVNQHKQHKHALLVYNSIKSLNFEFQAIDAPKYDETRLKIVVGFKN